MSDTGPIIAPIDRRHLAELAVAIGDSGATAGLSPGAASLGASLGLPFGATADRKKTAIALPERFLHQVLRLAARLDSMAFIQPPDAQGAAIVVAIADPSRLLAHGHVFPPVTVCGSHIEPLSAFVACVCEAAEYVSQIEHPGDVISAEASAGDQVSAADLHSLDPVMVNADALIIRPGLGDFDPFRLSSGCAVGVSLDQAVFSGVLELVERDAIARWWYGNGHPATALDNLSDTVSSTIQTYRKGQNSRSLMLLDIRQDIDIPVIAAISFDSLGRSFAAGYSANLDMEKACIRAIGEMVQMELGHHIVAVKREADGDATLSQTDMRMILRAKHIAIDDIKAKTGPARVDVASRATMSALRQLEQLLSQSGSKTAHSVTVANITRPGIDLPTIKAYCPTLEVLPPDPVLSFDDLDQKPDGPVPLF